MLPMLLALCEGNPPVPGDSTHKISLVLVFDIFFHVHYTDTLMIAMASKITCLTIVYSAIYLDAYQRKHQSSASLAFAQGSEWWIPHTKGQ